MTFSAVETWQCALLDGGTATFSSLTGTTHFTVSVAGNITLKSFDGVLKAASGVVSGGAALGDVDRAWSRKFL